MSSPSAPVRADDPPAPESPEPQQGAQDSGQPGAAAAPEAARVGALVSRRVALPLAVLTGLLYFVAFPGVDLWPLSFVTLVPLLIALRGRTPKAAAWLAWVSGFTMTMSGFYWLLPMLQTFSGFGTPLCLLFMAILCAYQSGRLALLGWLYGRAEQRGWPPGLVFTAAFVASELVFPLLFPWYFAATVHQVPVLLQTAELGGPILVALVLIAVNWAVAELVVARLERRRPRLRLIAALSAAPGVALVYGAVRIAQVDATVADAPKARVGIVQANMSLFGKRRDKLEGLRRHLRLTRELKREGPLDLVVWSETSVMSAVHEELVDQQYRRAFTRALGTPTIFGAVLKRPVEDARQYALFNTALISDTDGHIRGRYDKQYLLAFGEYLPLGDAFPILYEWSPNSGRFSPGKSLEPLPFGDKQVAVFICYEDIIPSFVNAIVRHGDPALLVNLTNDAWFGDTTEPWIHLALSKFRAIEHRRYFVRSTNSGVSAFIDPVGRVVEHTETFREQAIDAKIAYLTPTTPYALWGDAPWWLLTTAAFAMAFVPAERLRRYSKRRADT